MRGDGSSWSSEIRIAVSLSLCLLPLVLSLAPPLCLGLSLHPPFETHTRTHTHKPLSFLYGCIYVCLSSLSALTSTHPVRYAHKPGCFASFPLLQSNPPPPPPSNLSTFLHAKFMTTCFSLICLFQVVLCFCSPSGFRSHQHVGRKFVGG